MTDETASQLLGEFLALQPPVDQIPPQRRLAEAVVGEYISFGGLETGQQINTGRAAAGRTRNAPL
jgi:hypothetical protein